MTIAKFRLTLEENDLQSLKEKCPSLDTVELWEDGKSFSAHILNSNGDALESSSWTESPIFAYDEIGMIEMPIKATYLKTE